MCRLQINDEALFHRASTNLFKLAVALFLSAAVFGYLGFVHFAGATDNHAGMKLALRIAGGILAYAGLKAILIRKTLSTSTLPESGS